MDVNDNQQINTFVKGMNTDVSDALMDSSQYRYAENLRLATNTDENTGELHMIEGTAPFPWNGKKIKAMTSIRDILIVITEDNRIYKWDDSNEGKAWFCIFIPSTEDVFGKHLSLVTRWESDNNVKLYIADGAHLVMYINIKDPDNNTINDSSEIQSSTDTYLPPITEYAIQSGGRIPCVKVQYVYRFYKMGGAASQLSPFSKLITLYKSSSEGYGLDGAINNSVTLTIPYIKNAEYLLIYRIGYSQVGQQTDVNLIYDGKYVSKYKDVGNVVQELSSAEFDSLLDLEIKPALIESKGDYLFAANIRDVLQETDEEFNEDIFAHSAGDIYNNNTEEYDYNLQFDDLSTYNEEYWRNSNGEIGGDGKYVSWKLITDEIYIDTKNNRYNSSADFPLNPLTNPNQLDIVSLRPGEVYRYGAIFHTKTGKKTSAKWIADIMIPQKYNAPEYITYDDTFDAHLYRFTRYGIKFTVNWDLLASKFGTCEHVEIIRGVRSINDKITISQGICGYPLLIYNRSTTDSWASVLVEAKNAICPIGPLSTDRFLVFEGDNTHYDVESSWYDQFGITNSLYLILSSPEYCYQEDDIQDIINMNKNAISLDYNYCLKYNTVPYGRYSRIQPETNDHTFIFTKASLVDANLFEVAIKFGYSGSELFYLYDSNNAYAMGDADRQEQITFFANPTEEGAVKVSVSCPTLTTSEQPVNISKDVLCIGYSQTPEYDSLFDGEVFNGDNAISTIQDDTVSYINWTIPGLYENSGSDNSLYERLAKPFVTKSGVTTYPVGGSGKCIIIKTNERSEVQDPNDKLTIPVISIKKNNVSPYNGKSSVDTQSYASFGNIIDRSVAELDVYDGDCFPGVFVYNSSYTFDEPNLGNAIGQCNVYTAPIYSDIDLTATSGSLFTRLKDNKKYYVQEKQSNVRGFILPSDMYLYRTEYTSESYALEFSALEYTKLDSGLFDTRVFHSKVKTNNEHIDNWLTFESDHLDVDSRFGQITNMRLFKDKLLFWQEHAVGIISANERTLINDANDNNIILGTGDVLLRYDYISTTYGMKPHQPEAEVLSNTTQYWWDGYNKEILAYLDGMLLMPMSKTKSITNYINERQESEHPCLAYDNRYDEILAKVVGNNTIVYSEQILLFQSVYTFNPIFRVIVLNKLYLTSDNHIYVQNEQEEPTQVVLFGTPAFPVLKYIVNTNSQFVKTFDITTFGGRFYGGSTMPLDNYAMLRGNNYTEEYINHPHPYYIKNKDHTNAQMENLIFTFNTPLKQTATINGADAISVNEYDYRLAIPRAGSKLKYSTKSGDDENGNVEVKYHNRYEPQYGNRMRGKTMQCELKSVSNSVDFSLQYITTKFRISWS